MVRTWRTADGRELTPSEMDTNHLQNSLRLLERRGAGTAGIADDFRRELQRRGEKSSGAEEILVAPPIGVRLAKSVILC